MTICAVPPCRVNFPSGEEAQTPPMGRLLDLGALEAMLVQVAVFFEAADSHGCETEAVLREAA